MKEKQILIAEKTKHILQKTQPSSKQRLTVVPRLS
jgi:hypothetical protein